MLEDARYDLSTYLHDKILQDVLRCDIYYRLTKEQSHILSRYSKSEDCK